MKRLLASLLIALGLATLTATPALAQAWPNKTIRMVVPWPPGGGNDILGRILAEALSGPLGQSVIVDNKGGANGLIGAESVAKAAPDGYTIMFHSVSTHLINASFYNKVPYDTLGDFAPVSLIGEAAHILVANPGFAGKTVSEIVAMAKAQPGSLSYASFGTGSTSHLSGELFNIMTGVKLTHIPYKGSGPALADTLAGHVPLFYPTVAGALPSIRSGKLRAIAVTSSTRSRALPDVPTMDEAAGIRGFETSAMYGVWAPARTPDAVVARLNAEITTLLKNPAFIAKLEAQGVDRVIASTPDEMAAYLKAQGPKWAKLAKDSGAKGD